MAAASEAAADMTESAGAAFSSAIRGWSGAMFGDSGAKSMQGEEGDETTAQQGLDALFAQLEALSEERDKLREDVLRYHADMENLRKRTAKEKADAHKYAISGFAKDLLAVADNLDRAFQHKPDISAPMRALRDLLKVSKPPGGNSRPSSRSMGSPRSRRWARNSIPICIMPSSRCLTRASRTRRSRRFTSTAMNFPAGCSAPPWWSCRPAVRRQQRCRQQIPLREMGRHGRPRRQRQAKIASPVSRAKMARTRPGIVRVHRKAVTGRPEGFPDGVVLLAFLNADPTS